MGERDGDRRPVGARDPVAAVRGEVAQRQPGRVQHLLPGHHEELRERAVFESNARERAAGTGLGLAIAKDFVEAYEAKFGAKPRDPEHNAYMTMLLWADAIERAGTFYPAEVIKALEEKFAGYYTPSAGTVYPTLQLLEDEGYVRVVEAEGITDTHRIAQAVRRVVGKWVGETYRRRPMIVPTVLPVAPLTRQLDCGDAALDQWLRADATHAKPADERTL